VSGVGVDVGVGVGVLGVGVGVGVSWVSWGGRIGFGIVASKNAAGREDASQSSVVLMRAYWR
jgi:hypothetical protein